MAGKRRANGEGSLSKRKDGRWMARYKVLTNDGKKEQRTIYGHNKDLVAKEMREAIRLADLGQDINKSSMTLQNYYNYWKDNIAPNRLKPTTIELYDDYFEKWILPSLGKKRINKITTRDIQLMITEKERETGAKRRCQICKDAISSLLHFAVDQNEIIFNPARKVIAPNYEKKEKELLSSCELAIFFQTAKKNSSYSLAYELAYYCGLRRGEVLGLRKEDVDSEKLILKVRQQIVSLKNKPTILSTKTKTSVRNIPIPIELYSKISAFIAKDKSDCDLIFHTKTNNPISPNNLARDLNKIIKKANVKHITMHTLRHMACTDMINSGASLKTVQTIMGHSNPQVTIDIYQHSNTEDKRDAIKKLMKNL